MKIEAHVLSIADQGDRLAITGQGCAAGTAEWRPYCSVQIHVPMTDRNRRSFYVGRNFTLTIEPK